MGPCSIGRAASSGEGYRTWWWMYSWGVQDTDIGLGPIRTQDGAAMSSVVNSTSARKPLKLLANGTEEPIMHGNGRKQFVSQAGALPYDTLSCSNTAVSCDWAVVKCCHGQTVDVITISDVGVGKHSPSCECVNEIVY